MAKRGYTPEQILAKLREAEVHVSEGATVKEACRQISITLKTYYIWRREYGGMRHDQVKHLKELELENSRLKKLVAELNLDKAILKEAARGNF
jgi:transposase-like protein